MAGSVPNGPYLVLSDLTLGLLADIWGRPGELFAGGHRLSGRSVRWGGGDEDQWVRAPGLGIDANALVSRLLDRLVAEDGVRTMIGEDVPDRSAPPEWDPLHTVWMVDASGRSDGRPGLAPLTAVRTTYGTRCVLSSAVALGGEVRTDLTRLEAVPDGWVHLAPVGRRCAVVQAMVTAPPPDPVDKLKDLVGQTRSIAGEIADGMGPVAMFGAAPSLSAPLCAPGWIAVGDAACAFDPVSGSGTAHAMQGAILATAVIRGINAGLPVAHCLTHYRRRLHDAFVDHLRRCAELYEAAFSSPEWKAEVDVMRRTEAASATGSMGRPQIECRLRGLGLELDGAPAPSC